MKNDDDQAVDAVDAVVDLTADPDALETPPRPAQSARNGDMPSVTPGHVSLIGGEMLLWSDMEPGVGVNATSPLLTPAVERYTKGGARVLVLGVHDLALIETLAAGHEHVDVVLRGWKDADALSHETGHLPSVRVHCGDPGRLPREHRYDLVVALAGVEALATPDGLDQAPLDLTRRLLEFVADDGRLLVAVENPFGLDRIISAETRLVRDASSDWPRPGRGFVSPGLHDIEVLLDHAGFHISERLCLYPGPQDPAMAVSPEALTDPATADQMADLIAYTVEHAMAERPAVMDPFATVESAVLTGLGDRLSPGWLLVVDPTALTPVAHAGSVGLMVDTGVDPYWAVVTNVSVGPEGVSRTTSEVGLLAQRRVQRDLGLLSRGVVTGESLQRRWLRIIGSGELHVLRESVRNYWEWLQAQAAIGGEPYERAVFAFPANLVVRDGVQLADSSWRMSAPVDPEVLFAMHARRFLATMLRGGYPHPWSASATVDHLTVTFGAFVGLDVRSRLLEATHLEAELLATLDCLSPQDEMALAGRLLVEYAEPGALSGPYSLAHRESMVAVSRLGRELEEYHARVDWLESRVATRELQLRRAEKRITRMRGSLSFRIGRAVTWPGRAIAGLVSRVLKIARPPQPVDQREVRR